MSKLKIAVLSDCRMPTLPSGGHGLGRLASDIASGFAKRGHDVMLMAGPGSEFEDGALNITPDETWRAENWDQHGVTADVYFDLSHFHDLSRVHPGWPVLNWLVDTEFRTIPPNAIVGNEWQRKDAPTAGIVPLGIDVDAIPLGIGGGGFVLYAAKIEPRKGYNVAMDAAKAAGKRLVMAGEPFIEVDLPEQIDARYITQRNTLIGGSVRSPELAQMLNALPPLRNVEFVGHITDNALFYDLIGQADALLSPSLFDAGGRVVLEAAACGTPVLCLDGTGTKHHVAHGVSGYWCRNTAEITEVLREGDHLRIDRAGAREWVKQAHDMSVMLDKLMTLAQRVMSGERW